MAKAWFPFYLNDYLADTPLLSLAEHGAFCLMMMFYWNSDANAPASADRLHKICRCTTDAERDAVDHVVQEYFLVIDGKLTNARLDKELAKSASISASRAKAANAKHAKQSASAPTIAPASAEQVHTQSQSQSQSQSKDINPSSQKTSPVIQNKFDDEDLRFAEWMFSQIECLPGSHKKPDFKKWANTIRLMREREGHSLKAIGIVFKWANNDDFWSTNILSPSKLRDKFSQLSAKALKPESGGNGNQTKQLKTFEEQKLDTTKQAMVDFVKGGNDAEHRTGQGKICDIDG